MGVRLSSEYSSELVGAQSRYVDDLDFGHEYDDRGRSGRRPKLLFLSQTLPFPPDGGVNIRSYNVLRLLAREFDVTALCFYRSSARQNEGEVLAGIEGLSQFAEVEAFPIPQEHSRARLLYDHLRSVLLNRSYTCYAYASRAFEERLRELLTTRQFDLVHVDSLDLAGYLPLLAGLPIACTHHNVESTLLQRRADVEASKLKRLYYRHQAKLTRKEEQFWCNRIDLNLVVSAADGREMAALAPGARFVVVPNGVDTSCFQPEPSDGTDLVFVGGYDWFPNRDAMKFFLDSVLPLLRSSGNEVRLTWVGRAPSEVREEYARRYGVQLTGYVSDVRPFVQGAGCYVVPLRVGGGTRLKILDAWAMGKAVVSTSIGCEGLDARDGDNILIRDTAAEFAEAVRAVLADSDLRLRLGQSARLTAVNVYDWEVIGTSLLRDYHALVANSAQVSGR